MPAWSHSSVTREGRSCEAAGLQFGEANIPRERLKDGDLGRTQLHLILPNPSNWFDWHRLSSPHRGWIRVVLVSRPEGDSFF
jgi:hypothetical protein